MIELSDTFSTARLRLLWNYYSRWIYRQALIYGVIITMTYVVSLMSSYYVFLFWFVSGTGQSILWLLFYVGAIVFAVPDNRQIEIMLPTSVTEKATFYLGYTFVVVPAFIAAIWWICIGLGCILSDNGNIQALYSDVYSLSRMLAIFEIDGTISFLRDILSSLIIPATVLYCIINARRQRMLRGFCGIAIAYMAKIAISTVLMIIFLIPFVLLDQPEPGEQANIFTDFSSCIILANYSSSFFDFVLAVVMMVLTVKKLGARTV